MARAPAQNDRLCACGSVIVPWGAVGPTTALGVYKPPRLYYPGITLDPGTDGLLNLQPRRTQCRRTSRYGRKGET
eukprot:scaffold2391_cov124-Isochrysis_galbana.AAC.5